MGKYKLEKFTKAGNKRFIFSQHTKTENSEDWAGPVIERFAAENATKIGVFTVDGKFTFELTLLNPEGTDYVFKILNKDGIPNGATMVVANGCLYFGSYYSKDGFNGIVYRFKKGENVRTQEYKHGILVDECLTEYVLLDEVVTPLPFDAYFASSELVERKIQVDGQETFEYVAGDPTSHDVMLGAQVFPDGTTIIGQYKNNAFNGITLKANPDGQSYEIRFYEQGKPNDNFHFIYTIPFNGYALVTKKEDTGYLDLIYCQREGKYQMSIMDLNDRKKTIKESSVILPDQIDPNAPKPGINIKPKHKPATKDGLTAEERLNKLIGLEEPKKQIALLKAMYKKFKTTPDKINLHMCFTGNPGTGKTEVARLMAEILYDAGILEINKCIEVDASGLIGKYVGETQQKTHDVIKSAMGGVLFIDEAYALSSESYVTSKGDNFGAEAIAALIKDMEDNNGKFCVILAGYEEPIRNMIESNPGFKSRINRYVDFPNYSLPELKQIGSMIIEAAGYTITDDALEEIMQYVSSKMYREDFANAREIRNAVQSLYEYQALRTMDTPEDRQILIDDVYAFLKKKDPKTESGKTAEQRLDEMIGLKSVKDQILKLKAVLHKLTKEQLSKENLHMCFLGNPGTGKTEVAKLFADILYDAGILPTRNFITTDRSGLVGAYEGQTALKTHKIIHDALGGVLFIDEAYDLYTGPNDDFGKEAITALIQDMEQYRGKLCVIIAGYTKNMYNMIETNPGFKSRINKYIEFPDYSEEELKTIAEFIIAKNSYTIDKDALEEMNKIIVSKKEFPDFANAREVRNIFESLREIQAVRTIDLSDNVNITIDDVRTYEKDHNISFAESEKEKKNWDISYLMIKKLSEKWSNDSFRYTNDYVETASVNIKVSQKGKMVGEGSGFFIAPNGIICTNAHVVNDADAISVIVNLKMSNGQIINKDYSAETIAINVDDDVAIIGILNPEITFNYYPLAKEENEYPELLTPIVMGGYPMGGNRFASITLLDGKVQSINKDSCSGKEQTFVYVDLAGHPGSSGSGVIDKNTGRALSIFSGAALHHSDHSLKIRYSIPVKYLWSLLKSMSGSIETPKENETSMDEKTKEEEMVSNEFVPENSVYEHIHLVEGDISTFDGDAVVNAANSQLAPGGGVCGSIFDRAGYSQLKEACYKIGGCEVGHSVLTKGFDLKAKYIIHTVGPRYGIDENASIKLKMAYESAFEVAARNNCQSIAFPSLSTGFFGYPKEEAVPIALEMIAHFAGRMVNDVYIYVKGDTADLYKKELEKYKK